MKVKHLAHLALAGALVFGTGAAGAENQNQKGNTAQVRPGGGANVNAGGGAQLHAQPQGGGGINRGNAARIQNQNRITVRGQDFNRDVTRNRAVIDPQNFQKQSAQRIEQDRIRTGGEKRASARAIVQISQTQRVRIREAFRHDRGHFHRVARVGFPIFVGADVPSDYTFYDVSSDFAEYAPEYEGYKYIVVGDELLIIDPQTWEIVAVIPV